MKYCIYTEAANVSSESGAAASGASVQEGGDTPVAECQGLILEQMKCQKSKHGYAICSCKL